MENYSLSKDFRDYIWRDGELLMRTGTGGTGSDTEDGLAILVPVDEKAVQAQLGVDGYAQTYLNEKRYFQMMENGKVDSNLMLDGACFIDKTPTDLAVVRKIQNQYQTVQMIPVNDEIDDTIFEYREDGFLWKIDKKGANKLCNYYVKLLSCKIELYSKGKQEEKTYDADVFVDGKNINVKLCHKDLTNFANFVHQNQKIEGAYERYPFSVKMLNSIFAEILIKQVPDLPRKYCIREAGWFVTNDGSHVYAHDSATIPNGDYTFKTGINFEPMPISIKETWARLNSLSKNEMLLVPLLAYAHLPYLRELFCDAGFTPRTILFLNGPTGSMKTTITKLLFSFMLPENKKIECSFKDTWAGIVATIKEFRDVAILIDNFHPAEYALQREMNAKLLELVHLFGDNNGKNTSNVKKERVEGAVPRCCCVVTGEDTYGSESCLLRMLVLNVNSGDFNNENSKSVISFFQQNEQVLCSYFGRFINHIQDNYMNIVDIIRVDFNRFRKYLSDYIKELRLVDTVSTLLVTLQIIFQWLVSENVFSETEADGLFEIYGDNIISAVNQSRQTTHVKSEAFVYLNAITEMKEHGKIEIANSRNEFYEQIERFIGYIYEDALWLDPIRTYRAVVEWQKNKNEKFMTPYEKIHALLHKNFGLLLFDEKGTYLRKEGSGKRKRMLCIDIIAMQKILEKEIEDELLCCNFA